MLIENLSKHLGDGLDAEGMFWNAAFDLGKEIEEEMQRMLDMRRVKRADIRASKLPKLIEKHVGIKCRWLGENEGEANAYALRPTMTNDHVAYLEDYMKNFMREVNEGADYPKKPVYGWVDLKNGRIGGMFSEFEHTCGLDVAFFDDGYTARQITAIILHEIGHLFYFYAALSWRLSTNYYMDFVAKKVFGLQKEEERILYLTRAQLENNDIKDIDEIAKSKSLEQIQVILFKNNLESTNSALGINVYDHRGWEFLADKYATRAGYGADLGQSLEKMYRDFKAKEDIKTEWQKYFETVLAVWVIVMFSPLIVFGLLTANLQEEIYDSPKRRIEVIRKQIIEMLKEAPDKKTRDFAMGQINRLDKVLATHPEDKMPALVFLQAHFGMFGGRKRHRSLTTQKLLEHFANSELRVAAERLND